QRLTHSARNITSSPARIACSLCRSVGTRDGSLCDLIFCIDRVTFRIEVVFFHGGKERRQNLCIFLQLIGRACDQRGCHLIDEIVGSHDRAARESLIRVEARIKECKSLSKHRRNRRTQVVLRLTPPKFSESAFCPVPVVPPMLI